MILLVGAGLLYLAGEVSGINERIFDSRSCAEFPSQAEAQAAADADPELRKSLDEDIDRVVCEGLPPG